MDGWFSLEAVYAKKGDALILHYGSKNRPRWILIDGGHYGVYKNFLRPRLEELRLRWPKRPKANGKLMLEMVMVSHADADHLAGILDLTSQLRSDDPGIPDAPVDFKTLWFNGFEDLVFEDKKARAAETTTLMTHLAQTASISELDPVAIPKQGRDDHDLRAVVASTKQGRQLLNDVDYLNIDVNPHYGEGLIMRGGEHDSVTTLNGARHGVKLTLLGPDKQRIDQLRAKWKKDLPKILEKERAKAKGASFDDRSAFNLSSIIVLAERDGKTMLLTGDARGDDLYEGLEAEGLLDDQGKIAVDVFKLPHHGSDRNVKQETFRDITANHYLISANGEHDNPDTATLDMLVAGRQQTRNDNFTLHLTFPNEAFKRISEASANRRNSLRKQKEALAKLDGWLKTQRPDNMHVVYRDPDRRSLALDLGAEKVFA